MTRRTRGDHHSRRVVSILALAVSLLVLAVMGPATAPSPPALAAEIGPPDGAAVATATASAPATGGSGRIVVRIGAFVFALGSIATYVAAGSRRSPVRGVDADGRDL